ncbi:hypothetical protein B0H11DRAFT_2271617 [Mycena galericulata]|nr:hypothetical protein B0H11DRAFT_2271617 [Mycena galericulata]
MDDQVYVCSYCATPPKDEEKLRLCSRCKLNRYCSKQCQTTHWTQHKHSCRLGAGDVVRDVPTEYRAQTFAERVTRVPWLMGIIQMYAVAALGLDADLSNADRSCICARITTKPVNDSQSVASESVDKSDTQSEKKSDTQPRNNPGAEPGKRPKPIVMLQFEKFVIQPVSMLTQSMRKAIEKRRALAGGNDRPLLLLYFSTDGDNFLFTPLEIPEILIEYAKTGPVDIFEDGRAINAETAIAELNDFIVSDTENAWRLRGNLKGEIHVPF